MADVPAVEIGAGAPARASAARPRDAFAQRLRRPVISVGNLSLGGRGKTPVAGLIARILVAAGERPSILSRGYKRRRPEDGAVVVSDGVHLLSDVDRAGDEPLMLAREAPGAVVVVCDIRAVAGALAERALGATVHVLDDGFQHRALARDVDLVLLDASDLEDRRVPFGRLRESPAALARADALVVEADDSAQSGLLAPAVFREAMSSDQPVFRLRRWLGPPEALEPGRADGVFDRGRPVVAVCGIADPARFSRALERDGWTVAAALSFPDHHRFTRRDLADISAAVAERGSAGVLTTTKDAMRLLPLRPLPVAMAAVPLQVAIEPADRFRAWLLDRLAEARA